MSRLPFSLRHLAPFGLVSALILTLVAGAFWRPALVGAAALLGAYAAADVCAAIAAARGRWRLVPALLVAFPVLHLSYGFGSLSALGTLWRGDPRPGPGLHSRKVVAGER